MQATSRFSGRRRFLLPGVLALGLSLALAGSVTAEVRLPKVFGSHMVLQQNVPIVLWGWAAPNETVQITVGENHASAQANERGEWKATLPAIAAGGPYKVTVAGSNTVEFEDVLVGEVWLCSGQSNMEMGIGRVKDAKQEIADADHPAIRLLLVAHNWKPAPQDDIDAQWKVCSPATVAEGGWDGFSAAGYFFGRELNHELNVPVGLIDSTWGGTQIQSWTPPEGFAAVSALAGEKERLELAETWTDAHAARMKTFLDEVDQWTAASREALGKHDPATDMPKFPSELRPANDVQAATALFNGMIHPLIPFAIRGAIWYQGEANLRDGMLYCERMKALIGGWRQLWKEGDFPFYFVQIAPFTYDDLADVEPELWEAQASAAAQIPDTGMAVVNDIGDLKDIHPTDKQDVGHRLALLALAKTYGRSATVYSGATFKDLKTEDGALRVQFDHAEGLASRDGQPLTGFEIIDADEGGFVPAQAKIEGDSIVLSSPDVKHPVAMRFAWSMLAEPNLVNAAGLPTGAFRAGEVPKRDLLQMNVPEAKNYQLVYDLDLASLGSSIHYTVDHHNDIHQPFDRIAYFIELGDPANKPEYLFVSMNAFTDDLGKIGVPTVDSGAQFQMNVQSLDVFSNVRGIRTGSDLSGGNIEFWPNNYGQANSAGIPNASDSAFDFGDQPSDPVNGYGCMQVHNHDARQTLFSVNHWSEGDKADIGIGNQRNGNPDWTFAANAASRGPRRLRVFVHLK